MQRGYNVHMAPPVRSASGRPHRRRGTPGGHHGGNGVRHPSKSARERNSPRIAAPRVWLARGSRHRGRVSLCATSPGEPKAGCEYKRRRPEVTVLYDVVRDNVETLHGAIDDCTLDVRLPFHAIKELDAYLDCGLLCRGFAALQRCGALTGDASDASDANGETDNAFEARLAASAVSGQTPRPHVRRHPPNVT